MLASVLRTNERIVTWPGQAILHVNFEPYGKQRIYQNSTLKFVALVCG